MRRRRPFREPARKRNAPPARAAGLPRPRVSEQLLIEATADLSARSVVTTSLGRAQLARDLAAAGPEREVKCVYLDAYLAEQARLAGELPANLAIECLADAPAREGGWQAACLPLKAQGEAELARDQLQTAYELLAPGGMLYAATDNPKDTWLYDLLKKLVPGKVGRIPVARRGVVYRIKREAPLSKLKDYRCEFVFRHGEQLLKAVSRPGVFAHRRIDPGARALINVMDVAEGERVLDIGCGSGVVSLAAASMGGQVEAVDANVRAVECTARGAELNGLSERITTQLAPAEQAQIEPGVALALANPPYFSSFKIAEAFLGLAARALRPGGRVIVVTKQPNWFRERLPEQFEDVVAEPVKGYTIVTGLQPGG